MRLRYLLPLLGALFAAMLALELLVGFHPRPYP